MQIYTSIRLDKFNLQQNNMNPTYKNQSANHHYQQLFHKNNKLYQQLIQGDHSGNYTFENKRFEPSNIAPIKFNVSSDSMGGNRNYIEYTQAIQQIDSYGARNHNLFKNFESPNTKISFSNLSKSFPDTFSIIEHENEQNSTINIYSLSRNQIEQNLSISSNALEGKARQDEDCQSARPFQSQEQSKQFNCILDSECLQQQIQKKSKNSVCEEEKITKHKSEQYSYQTVSVKQEYNVIQEDQDTKVPKLLTDSMIKKQMNRKLQESSRKSKNEPVQKDIMTNQYSLQKKQVYQTNPYNIIQGNFIQKRGPTNKQQTSKSIILSYQQIKRSQNNRNNRKVSDYQSEKSQDKHKLSPEKKKYIVTYSENKSNSINISCRTIHSVQSAKVQRETPKSEPKYHVLPQKMVRSNSIDNKSKPMINAKSAQVAKEKQESSQTFSGSKLLKNSNPEQSNQKDHDFVQFQQESIIYESNAFDICCGFSKKQETSNDGPNKINYLPIKQKQTNLVYIHTNLKGHSDALNSYNLPICNRLEEKPRSQYKINPIQSLREKKQTTIGQPLRAKKGLRLIGYSSKKVEQ